MALKRCAVEMALRERRVWAENHALILFQLSLFRSLKTTVSTVTFLLLFWLYLTTLTRSFLHESQGGPTHRVPQPTWVKPAKSIFLSIKVFFFTLKKALDLNQRLFWLPYLIFYLQQARVPCRGFLLSCYKLSFAFFAPNHPMTNTCSSRINKIFSKAFICFVHFALSN